MAGPSGEAGDVPGLCATCVHARVQTSPRGSAFWRCARAEHDARFPRYPPLPVRSCPGHETRRDADGRG